ncbi:MAG: DNA mismatch repair endonuclease MutL [Nitrospirae bacterium]|nr:DNA mismatch repair endonuclease MutL [Nitrospirota bacterium]
MNARPRIHLLPDHLINQIAAGEVVERPASAVKELIENALDAGATRIVLEVEHGGKRLIRIVDNGHGIEADDLPLAVTRHATSKINSLDDLCASLTLGFRGEALPSIASVSHLTIRSTVRGAPEGRELAFGDDGRPRLKAAPPVPGTTVEVAELFHNTPARAKFLKGDGTEWGHIAEVVNEVALGAPAVLFSLSHNGRAAKVLPAAPDLAARVRQIYPAEVTEQLIPVAVADPEHGLELTGLVSRPGFTRSGREFQKLLVNGRCIKNTTLSHAVYAAFETNLSAGRHPLFFLALRLPPRAVDVNVHPAKREVRFAQSNPLHHFVREAVRQALGAFRGNALRLTRMAPPAADAGTWEERVRQAVVHSLDTAREAATAPAAWATPAFPTAPAAPTQLPMADVTGVAHQAAPLRVVGQLHNTFVLVEQGSQLRIIDQHTAHERVLFERLQARLAADGLAAQRLLIPADVTLPPALGARVAARQEELARLGIDIEPFGGESFIVRALPAPLAHVDVNALVADIADDLADDRADSPADAQTSGGDGNPPGKGLGARLHKLLATIACHAAVKAGDPLSGPQMAELVRDLGGVRNPHTCPHGRAVTAVLDRAAVKRLFDRNWGA